MIYHLSNNNRTINGIIEIGGSKSESNRLLMIREYSSDFKITNLSKSDDTKTLIDALINTNKTTVSKTSTISFVNEELLSGLVVTVPTSALTTGSGT